MNRSKFFSALRPDRPGDGVPGQNLFLSLTQQQVDGISRFLDIWDRGDTLRDDRHLAYGLATDYWETGRRMWPVREIGQGRGRRYGVKHAPRSSNSNLTVPNDHIYYGRGDVQLTWYDNYQLLGNLLKVDLVGEPDLALDPMVSARILVEGMMRGASSRGDFTGRALEDYFSSTKNDPVGARRIINGTDHDKEIAGIYEHWLRAVRFGLTDSLASAPAPILAEADHLAAISVEPLTAVA